MSESPNLKRLRRDRDIAEFFHDAYVERDDMVRVILWSEELTSLEREIEGRRVWETNHDD